MELRLSDVLASMSHALDITEGQPRGHAARSCLIGMRLADAAGLDAATRSSLFYALLLKDAGCSSNAAKVASLYGNDDADIKRDRKVTDHLRPVESIRHLARSTAPGASPLRKARHLRALVAHGSAGSRELTALRCDRGADVARSIGLDETTARAIHDLDEHWDGRGYPLGLAGDAISLCGRILCLAQTVEVFFREGGAAAACDVARARRGGWFDPALVDALLALEGDAGFWTSLHEPDVSPLEPADLVVVADDAGLDRVAEAFARIVDAKSPYTARHSAGVAELAVALGQAFGLGEDGVRELRRAGLLHDVGKLGVSNLILDKPGRLDPEEWEAVRRHPAMSVAILERVPALGRIAELAGSHHERLDGRGYPHGLTGEQLDLPARILAAADVAEALSAERPYREALPSAVVLKIMRKDAPHALDGDVVEALQDVLEPPLANAA